MALVAGARASDTAASEVESQLFDAISRPLVTFPLILREVNRRSESLMELLRRASSEDSEALEKARTNVDELQAKIGALVDELGNMTRRCSEDQENHARQMKNEVQKIKLLEEKVNDAERRFRVAEAKARDLATAKNQQKVHMLTSNAMIQKYLQDIHDLKKQIHDHQGNEKTSMVNNVTVSTSRSSGSKHPRENASESDNVAEIKKRKISDSAAGSSASEGSPSVNLPDDSKAKVASVKPTKLQAINKPASADSATDKENWAEEPFATVKPKNTDKFKPKEKSGKAEVPMKDLDVENQKPIAKRSRATKTDAKVKTDAPVIMKSQRKNNENIVGQSSGSRGGAVSSSISKATAKPVSTVKPTLRSKKVPETVANPGQSKSLATGKLKTSKLGSISSDSDSSVIVEMKLPPKAKTESGSKKTAVENKISNRGDEKGVKLDSMKSVPIKKTSSKSRR